MYAVIKTGGKQYQVKEGDVVFIEKIDGESGASVNAKIVGQTKGKKVIIFKMKSKKGYRNKTGHRQPYTKVEITKINA